MVWKLDREGKDKSIGYNIKMIKKKRNIINMFMGSLIKKGNKV
jgi:hypothetical protein